MAGGWDYGDREVWGGGGGCERVGSVDERVNLA